MEIVQVIKDAVAEAIADALPTKGIARPKDFPVRFGMSQPTLYRRMKDDPEFPKPIKLDHGGGLGFFVNEVESYLRNKPRINRYQANK